MGICHEPAARRGLRGIWGVLLVGVLLCSGAGSAALAQELGASPTDGRIEAAVDQLLEAFPKLQVDRDGFGRTFLYGAPMSEPGDADAVVEAWLARHAVALGCEFADLELVSVTPLSNGRATVYAYRIWNGGVSVLDGAARVLVRPDAAGASQVVYAAAHTALAPKGGYPPVQVTSEAAEATARGELPAADTEWLPPALVIEPSASRRAASRLVWHVEAHRPGSETWTVVIDPTTGDVLEVRDERVDVDVDGEVRGRVTPANAPDTATNPAVEIGIEGVEVSIAGGATALTAADGTFTIPNAGTGAVTVNVSLVGPWVQVFDQSGTNITVSSSVTPPGPITLELNPIADELTQAQVNGFHFTTRTHDFIRDRTPTGLGPIDVPIPCNVNLNDVCNAFYDPGQETINFFLAGGGCVNTTFSSVVSHEYGHFVVHMLGLSQGAFGEGFGDVMSMLMYDDPIIGQDFQGPGTVVRDPVAENLQYPCSGQVHYCGMLLGGTWWDIRLEFGAAFGSASGLDQASQLFVDWMLITLGGQGDSSAHPQTAIEVLTVDDDDGFLDNGTPRFDPICAGFASHSIDCPTPPAVIFSFPAGLPNALTPQASFDIPVEIAAGTGIPQPSTAFIHVRAVGDTIFTPIPMTFLGSEQYTATIPAQTCGGLAGFYFSVQDDGGTSIEVPELGSADPIEASVYDSSLTIIQDDMETDTGWVAGAPGDTATTGIWTRVDPIGTAAQPANDNSPVGDLCWVTGQGTPGGSLGENDVDGGYTTLTTPLLDLSTPGDYTIRYFRWFSNDTSAQPNTELLTVDISTDGTNWASVEVVGPAGAGTSGGWFSYEFDPATLVTLNSTVRLRFVVGDPDPGSLVEAAIDDFEVISRSCSTEPQFQRGDVNGDGSLDITDPISILNALFSSMPLICDDAGDVNDDGGLNVADAIVELSYLFAGGPGFPAPFLVCGSDPTADAVDCATEPGGCP